MSDKKEAKKMILDIPRGVSIELPLNVINIDKAVDMLGGKKKITDAIKSCNKSFGLNESKSTSNILELKLRNDPFHHPVQSLIDFKKKILIKISIPKKSIPESYYKNNQLYSVRELIKINAENEETSDYIIKPILIIDKTYLFKSIADFQYITKNNNHVQNFKNTILSLKDYSSIEKYISSSLEFDQNFENYCSDTDHKFSPPPIFSTVRFPYNYKFQKNQFTVAIKDEKSGEIKVVSTKNAIKLHTQICTFNTKNLPTCFSDELKANYELLISKESKNDSQGLICCIRWLDSVFDFKPVWLRKHLDDMIPQNLRRYLKQALPYVSFIYKNGPWRFCNIKFGVDPRKNNSFWKFQIEYFRLPKFSTSSIENNDKKISLEKLSNNLKEVKPIFKNMLISESLFFNGVDLPSTMTFQVGDLFDSDIASVLNKANNSTDNNFFRDEPDFQDGWIKKFDMIIIRKIIKYKLNRIANELQINHEKIHQIKNTDFSTLQKSLFDKGKNSFFDKENSINNSNSEDHSNDSQLSDFDCDVDTSEIEINEEYLLKNLDKFDTMTKKNLTNVLGFVKQDLNDYLNF